MALSPRARLIVAWMDQFAMNEGMDELLRSIRAGAADFKADLLALAQDDDPREAAQLRRALGGLSRKDLLELARHV